MNTATGTKTTTTSVTRNPNRRGHCAVLAVLFAMGASAAQAATTLWVDHAAMPMSSNTGCGPSAGYTTIGAAVAVAGGGDIIQVCPGLYGENVSIPAAGLTINGGQAGNAVAGRVSGGPLESTVQGANPIGANPGFRINAANVIIDGFTVKNSITTGAAIGIDVKNAG